MSARLACAWSWSNGMTSVVEAIAAGLLASCARDLLGDLPGDERGAFLGAVGDEDGGGALLDEVAGGELGHLAGADEQDGLALQRAEDLAREIHRDRGDGDGGAADLRLGADALGYGEGALEQRIERGGDGADFARDGVGLLYLAEDLRLADDHGVERRRDAEEVADGFAVAELVQVRLDSVGGDGEVLVEEAEQARVGRGRGSASCR